MERIIIDRYLRHQSIKWLNQEELFQKNVLIVGMGAIGNEVLKNLVLLGVGNITIIDYDTIELHNLTRSVFFREEDIGKSKVEIASKRAKELNPDKKIKITTYKQNFYDVIQIDYLKKYDVVFSAVDNYEARILLHRLCYLANVDFINSGIDSQFVNIEYYPYGNKKENEYACLECNLNAIIYQNIQTKYSCGWIERSAYRQNQIPTTIITASICGSMMVSIFLRNKEYTTSTKIFMNTFNGESYRAYFSKNEECFFCSQWKTKKEIDWEEFTKYYSKKISIETSLFLNEPILISTYCENCKHTTNIWELSRRFKDKDLICSECNSKIQPEVKDTFTINDIPNLEKLSFKYLYFFDNNQNLTYLVKKI